MVMRSAVFATGTDAQGKIVMNIFELRVKAIPSASYVEVARRTISASVEQDTDTLAICSLKRKDNARQVYMVELYENSTACRFC